MDNSNVAETVSWERGFHQPEELHFDRPSYRPGRKALKVCHWTTGLSRLNSALGREHQFEICKSSHSGNGCGGNKFTGQSRSNSDGRKELEKHDLVV